jgi:thiamine pyrophosphate-dependent acetolactate synthase large subunit-like protein
MNGAESLVRTLIASDVNVCFANPGTSEMHFVAALDRVEGIRCVLGPFEGVVTGAADTYHRLAEKPASTLLHLGPGLDRPYPDWLALARGFGAEAGRATSLEELARELKHGFASSGPYLIELLM